MCTLQRPGAAAAGRAQWSRMALGGWGGGLLLGLPPAQGQKLDAKLKMDHLYLVWQWMFIYVSQTCNCVTGGASSIVCACHVCSWM